MTVSNQMTSFLPNICPIEDCDSLATMFDSRENTQKLEKEIAYAKKLETFVHTNILPEIAKTEDERNGNIDDIAHNDFHGLRERIFTCTAGIDRIIERHNKNTDHVDLLLDLIIRENQIFTDVINNGTQRGDQVEATGAPHLDLDMWTITVCENNAVATTFKFSRDS